MLSIKASNCLDSLLAIPSVDWPILPSFYATATLPLWVTMDPSSPAAKQVVTTNQTTYRDGLPTTHSIPVAKLTHCNYTFTTAICGWQPAYKLLIPLTVWFKKQNKTTNMCDCSLHPQWQTCMMISCTRAVINSKSRLPMYGELKHLNLMKLKAIKHTMLFHNLIVTAMHIMQNKITLAFVVKNETSSRYVV